MFKLIENKKGFSSKGHITQRELAKCFLDAVASMVSSGIMSLALFQQLVLEMKWLFLGLYGLIFIATFAYKLIQKIARDGGSLNGAITKETLDLGDYTDANPGPDNK